jgi:peptide/nickel transport system ATP-binding protein
MALLGITRLSVDFPDLGVSAVRDLTFDVHPGEAVGLLGPSGSGKSTLAWSLLNLHHSRVTTRGSVWLDGTDLLQLGENEIRPIRGRDVALISQEPAAALHPLLRIGDQLREVFRAHYKTTSKACERRIREVLDEVGLSSVDRILLARPHQMSGGECQRAAIAQALICGPRLLIADEPTSALDADLEQDLLALLRELKDSRRMALLLITHNPGILTGLVDRVVVINDGQLVESGTVDSVYAAPRHPFTRELLRVWRARQTPQIAMAPGSPLITAVRLTKLHTQRTGLTGSALKVNALNGVDFTVREGEVVAIVGPSGSGKSTLGRCLAGLENPTTGVVHRHFKDRRDVQYVFPDALSSMNPRLTVSEIIAEPLRLRFESEADRLTVQELIALVGLPPAMADRMPSELSGGQRQRVAIARALAARPRVLILDESLSGLDLPLQAQLLAVLLERRRLAGIALVFILHDLRLAQSIADRVVELRDGRFVPDEVRGVKAS